MFYSKYNDNTHITDNITNIPINDLKSGDNVLVLVDNTKNVFTYNIILNEIQYDNNIYEFFINKNNLSHNELLHVNYLSAVTRETTTMLCYNDKLIHLFDSNNLYNSWDNPLNTLIRHVCDTYSFKGKHGTIYSGIYNSEEKDDDEDTKNNIVLNYLILPIGSTHSLLLVTAAEFNSHKITYNTRDYVTIIKTKFENLNNTEVKKGRKRKKFDHTDLVYFEALAYNKCYACNTTQIFDAIKNDLPSDVVTSFGDTLFALNYKLKTYLEDNNKNENIQKANELISSAFGFDFELPKKYAPVFEHPNTKVKSYQFSNNQYVTIDDEIINCGDGSYDNFEDKIFYSGDIVYNYEAPEVIKNNKKLQTMYRIAYKIAEFEFDKHGFDPRSGEFFHYGKKIKNKIKYQDNESFITDERYANYYIKKYGYFIEANNEEVNEIRERYELSLKLAEKA